MADAAIRRRKGPFAIMDAFETIRIMRALRETPEIFGRLGSGDAAELRLQQQLRQEFPADVVRAAFELHDLRQRARQKFSHAERMWFDRQGLEQSTPEAVARHIAQRFEGLVWDYCCGIGGDAVALADHCEVIGVDCNAANVLRAQWNAEVHGVEGNFQGLCADVKTLADRDGLVRIDPDRRPGNNPRTVRIENFEPGLEFLHQLIDEFRGGAIKVSPASNFLGKFSDCEIELVSLAGECKEATIWFGDLTRESPFRATVLPAGATLAGNPWEAISQTDDLAEYLYDPDPAIVRAGLVDVLCEQTGLLRLDAAEEYLTSSERIDSPFVTPFEVLAQLPNQTKEIRRYFRDHAFGQVEIKCRHIPIDAQAVRKKLSLNGKEPITLFFLRQAGKSQAVVAKRLPAD